MKQHTFTKLPQTLPKNTPKKLPKKLLSLVVATCLITACQSVPKGVSIEGLNTNQNTALQAQQAGAKAQLSDVLARQLRSNFSYQSNVYLSNQARLDELNKALDSNSPDSSKACEDEHDSQYKALLTKAKAEGLDISADYYLTDKEAIRSAFLACIAGQQDSTWNEFNLGKTRVGKAQNLQNAEEFFALEENQDFVKWLLTDDKDRKSNEWYEYRDEGNELKTLYRYYVEEGANDGILERELEVYYGRQSYTDTANDARKAELFKAYLIEPSSVQMVGSYRPLQGMMTFLPQANYEHKNLSLMANQPMYLDFKSGVLYLWADNIAFANAKMIDNELGTKWQNKWLAIPVNDGSLPEGFYQDFVKSFMQAQKDAFATLNAEGFDYVTADEFGGLTNDILSDDALGFAKQAQQIIRHTQTESEAKANRKAMLTNWHTAMTQKYPILLETPAPADTPEQVAQYLTSKVIMQRLFGYMVRDEKQQDFEDFVFAAEDIDDIEKAEAYAEEDLDLATEERQAKQAELEQDFAEFGVMSAADEAAANKGNDTLDNQNEDKRTAKFYGILGNQLLWIYQPSNWLSELQIPIPTVRALDVDTSPVLQAGVFTRFDSKPLAVNFSRLPKDLQTPNTANSVNLLDYGQDLVMRIKDDEKMAMAQFLLKVWLGVDSGDDYDYDYDYEDEYGYEDESLVEDDNCKIEDDGETALIECELDIADEASALGDDLPHADTTDTTDADETSK